MNPLGKKMIYAVTALDDEHIQKLQAQLEMAKTNHSIETYDDYAPRFILVEFDGTVRSLGEILGMNDEHGVTGVVLKLPRIFFGYAKSDMWEWISLNRGRGDG